MKPLSVLVPALRGLGRSVRDAVVRACESQSLGRLRTLNQPLRHELWAVAGQGAFMERLGRVRRQRRAIASSSSITVF